MSKNFAKSFEAFGVQLKNPRADWSAVSDDGKTVVISIWRDELDYTDNKRPVLDCRQHPRLAEWSTYRGNKLRRQHIEHALGNCDGLFKVVLLEAKDINVLPREIARAWEKPEFTGKITHLDTDTGAFRAEFLLK